jgi:hypothetical protein
MMPVTARGARVTEKAGPIVGISGLRHLAP